jgi:acetylornithine deacetylase/succinyl-diaminopimelate desuccinylase-like protein
MDPGLLALCKRLIATRSVSAEGTRHIAELCANEILAPAGITARLISSVKDVAEQVNLVAFIEGRERTAAPIVLNTHLDTVPPGDPALWTACDGNPFEACVDGDRIYGLGAADTKLDFVAKASALAQCGRPRRDVWLVATFGEERGLAGAKEIAAAGILPRGAIAMVGEPSHLQVITAHKGLMAFQLTVNFTPLEADSAFEAQRVTFVGKAAHSSTPALGDNAIVKALAAMASRPKVHLCAIEGGDAVNKVPARCEVLVPAALAASLGGMPGEHAGPRENFIPAEAIAALSQFVAALNEFADRTGPAEPDYAAPTLTCNPGVIRTVGHDSITLEFELRPPPSLALDPVRKGVAAIVDRIAYGPPNVQLGLTEKRANPGFRSPAASETVELAMGALAQAGLALESGVKAGCTEAGIYAAAGLKPVVFGPGPSTGVIHAPNEYNLLSEVEGAVRFYRALLAM